jgi:hypothetical protein
MDYKAMADEYYKTAENLQRTQRKYEDQLKTCKACNREKLNGTIAYYRSLHREMIHTAVILSRRANGEYAE